MVIGWRYTPYGCIAPAPPGGCTRGGSAERFETPLVGGAARSWRLGGNPPTPAFPRRGKRERGRFKFRAPQANYQRGCPGNLSSDGHPRKSLQPLKSRNSQKTWTAPHNTV